MRRFISEDGFQGSRAKLPFSFGKQPINNVVETYETEGQETRNDLTLKPQLLSSFQFHRPEFSLEPYT